MAYRRGFSSRMPTRSSCMAASEPACARTNAASDTRVQLLVTRIAIHERTCGSAKQELTGWRQMSAAAAASFVGCMACCQRCHALQCCNISVQEIRSDPGCSRGHARGGGVAPLHVQHLELHGGAGALPGCAACRGSGSRPHGWTLCHAGLHQWWDTLQRQRWHDRDEPGDQGPRAWRRAVQRSVRCSWTRTRPPPRAAGAARCRLRQRMYETGRITRLAGAWRSQHWPAGASDSHAEG